MESKLAELTKKIYAEGVEKAREEAESILKNAREEAEKILEEARREAKKIKEQAEKEAEETQRNAHAELQLAARQASSALKQKIARLVMTEVIDKPVKKAFAEPAFIKELIEKLIEHWNPEEANGMGARLTLPAETEKRLDEYLSERLRGLLNEGLHIDFDEKQSSGFRVGPADGSYQLSFSEADFENFFKEFLRPRAARLLYGNHDTNDA
jgi:V/A-type H+-transporting ATPase subunit E